MPGPIINIPHVIASLRITKIILQNYSGYAGNLILPMAQPCYDNLFNPMHRH